MANNIKTMKNKSHDSGKNNSAKKSSMKKAVDDTKPEISAVINFNGKALDHVRNLQDKYYSKFHRAISKSDAVNMLISKFPDVAVNQYIKLILDEMTSEN